jgi:uncharacterized repeat protein (TIGR02543 family)
LKDLLAGSEVTFNTNGGIPVPARQYVWKGNNVVFPSFPSKFGFIFAGWYLDNFTFNFPWNFSINPSGDMILHAKWTPIDFGEIGDGCAHDWGDWEETPGFHNNITNACTNGIATRHCLNCNRTQTRSIPCAGTQELVIIFAINNFGGIVDHAQSLTVANVCIPDYRDGVSVISIGNRAFWNNNTLVRVRIGRNVTSISNEAFSGNSTLTTVTFAPGSQLTTIGQYAFLNTSLTNITIPAGVTSIGGAAFSGCTSLTNITIPASVTHIGDEVFLGCTNLATVTFAPGSQLQVIGWNAFQNCTSLTNIIIPASVANIGGNAFFGCTNLATVRLLSTTPPQGLNQSTFGNTHTNLRIVVPSGSAAAYRGASQWDNWANRIHSVGCTIMNNPCNPLCQ